MNTTSLRKLHMTIGSGLACLLVGSLAQGLMTGRWSAEEALATAARAFDAIPNRVGMWERIEDRPVEAKVLRLLEARRLAHCVYRHRESGDLVVMALLLGPTGSISVHSPEICFSSRAYDFNGSLERIGFDLPGGSTAELWARTFLSLQPGVQRLRVYYGWNAHGNWVAPRNPRWQLRGAPYLWKLQVASPIPPQIDVNKVDFARDFLTALLPALQPVVTTRNADGGEP